MATFLQMCATVMRDGGLAGEIASVSNQVGIRLLVASKVAEADYAIQGKFHNWKFLWKQWTKTLTIGATIGAYNDYAPPTDIGEFINGTVKIDGNRIALLEYERARETANATTTGTPSAMVVLPTGWVRLTPIPTAANALTAEYYRSPLRMTASADLSLIPAKHHRAIETLAIANIHASNEDFDGYKLAMIEHAAEMIKLEASQLSGHISRTDASGADNAVHAE